MRPISEKQLAFLFTLSEQRNTSKEHFDIVTTYTASNTDYRDFNVLIEQIKKQPSAGIATYKQNKAITSNPDIGLQLIDNPIADLMSSPSFHEKKMKEALALKDMSAACIHYITLKDELRADMTTFELEFPELTKEMQDKIDAIPIPDGVGKNNDKTETSHLSNILV